MRVRVRLFATYREIVGRGDLPWTLREGGTLEDLLEGLLAAHPGLRPHRGSMLLAVNREFATPDVRLRPGDEVAVMPPVSGGAR